MSRVYSDEQLAFLKEKWKTLYIDEVTKAFNEKFSTDKTESQLKACIKNHKFKCGDEPKKPRCYAFTQEQLEWIKTTYVGRSRKELTELYNKQFPDNPKTYEQMVTATKNHGFTSGLTGHFVKGHVPFNKGKKGSIKPNSGSFKPGSVPPNRKPLGSERLDTKTGHILVKVEEINPYNGQPTRYKHKHVVVWEQHHGSVPKDMVVSFVDGDKTNCSIENLELISRSMLLRLNRRGFAKCPDDLKPVLRTSVKLEVKTFEVIKELGQ